MHFLSCLLASNGTVLKESDALDIYGVTFDSKMTFEKSLPWLPEQLLKGLAYLGSQCEYLMIDSS